MPPKPKFTRDEIAAAAFEIIKTQGTAALTARDLGARMGTSARPIFTVFRNMEEVKLAARELALAEFREYVSDYRDYTPAFKRIGMMIVSYGIHEPELFKLLFMQEHTESQNFENTLQDLGGIAEVCIQLIQDDYAMAEADARLLFEQMWTHAFGLGAMCAMGVCDLSEEEIGRREGIMFASLVMLLKSGKVNQVISSVEKNPSGRIGGVPVSQHPFTPDQD